MSLLQRAKNDSFEEVWEGVEGMLQILMSTGESTDVCQKQWLELYTRVYKLCTCKQGMEEQGKLYEHLKMYLEGYCAEMLKRVRSSRGSDLEILSAYCTQFKNYYNGMKFGTELLNYLNRFWIKIHHCESGYSPIAGVYQIHELVLKKWKMHVFDKMHVTLLASVLQMMREARNTKLFNCQEAMIVADVVKTFIDLGQTELDPLQLYRTDFEVGFIESTTEYYKKISATQRQNGSVAEYLSWVESILREELARCDGRLHRITVKRVQLTCHKVLVEEHSEFLTDSIMEFMEQEKHADLQRMFDLFVAAESPAALNGLKGIFRKYVERIGQNQLKEFTMEKCTENPEMLVQAILQVHVKYEQMVRMCFSNNAIMLAALDQACRAFVNAKLPLAEILAKYAHHLMDNSSQRTPKIGLRRSMRHRMNEEDIETRIENIGVVFRLLDDKDIFKKYYAKLLAMRLIQATSISDDCELFMIQQLREICGHDFVSKLRRMFADKGLSKHINNDFHDWVQSVHGTDALPMSMYTLVITTGSWPIETPVYDLKVPLSLQLAMERFTTYYASQSSGRRLHWALQYSDGIVESFCFGKKYDFQVSTFQMMILDLFNDFDVLTTCKICEMTKLPVDVAIPQILGLVDGKLLLQVDESINSPIQINLKFFSKRNHVTIETSMPPEAIVAERSSSDREINADRNMIVQAALTRILKIQTTSSHNALLLEVTKVLQPTFLPSVTMIKQNIESLIEKEYISRTDSTTYTYVA